MIEIYLKTNTNYDKNGDITLTPTSCTYKDSEKELVLEHLQDEEGRWKYIAFENVIAAEENGKKKLYRIYNVVKSLNSVTAYARPIFYDLIDKVLLDVRPTEKNGQEALNIILADTGFKGHSNILSLNTAYYVRKNIVEALIGDANNAFINRWGGEFYCENFDIYINQKVGSDNGVKVEFGYNLNEIEENINIEDVVTRIIPVGFNGIMLEGESPWIDSPLINKYTHIKSRIVEFSNIKVKEGSDEEGFETIEEARAEMIKQCKLLYENGADKPSINYKIDMINLANTTEYEHLKMLVNVNKGDTVICYIKHLDIDVKARVIDYEKDLLTGEYISIELGNIIDNFFDNQADIQHKVDNVFNDNGNIKAETLEGAINALQTKFEALRDVAQPQQVRAILFEDRIEDSPTFGCMCLGTFGFEIAGSFKPGTKEWDFRTFGTGQGFVADHIITGVLNAALIKAGKLESMNKSTWISMEDGTFNFANKVKFDGKKFTIDLTGEDLTTNESIKVAFKVMNDAISSKVSNGEFESYIEQTDKKISSKVSNGEFESYKEQTAEHIRTEVKNVKDGLESKITQTAKDLQTEYKDIQKGLESKITQTAGDLKSEYTDKINKTNSTLTQTAGNLEAKITDAKSNLQSQITLNKDSIKQKVGNDEFTSYKKQTANEIASKVASKDLSTVVKQNAHSWGISINGKLKGTNYVFDGENFTIGTTKGENTAYHSNDRSLWKHQDGGYTRVSANGLERYAAGEHRKYHYLMHGGTVQIRHTAWVSLPPHIANKVGTNYSVSISARAYGFDDATTVALMQLYCAVLEKKADQFSIRVDMYGWKPLKDDWRGKQTWDGWVNVDYVIIA